MKRFSWEEIFRGKFLLQIFSFFVAFGLWVFVNSGQNIEDKRSVKIQYIRMPASLTFEKSPMKEVAIILRGPLYRLRALSDEDLTFLVDLSSGKSGGNRVELTLDALRLPLDLEASFPSPKSFYVYLEELVSKEVPVKAVFTGALAEGLSVSAVHLSPLSVRISGPRSTLAKIEAAPIEVSLDTRTASFSFSDKPKLSLPSVEVSDSVMVEVEVSAVKLTREFESVAVVADGGRSIKIEPSVATVIVEGTQRELQTLNWQPQVNLATKDLKRGRYLLRGKIDLPPGLRLLEIRPQNFLVEIAP